MESKVTAIVSAYYAEKFIRGRILNLLEQDPQPEIVVIALRGSPEATEAMKHPLTLVLSEHIPTIYRAWNIGIQASTREYLTNANCDDYHMPGGLARLQQALDDNPRHGIVYSALYLEHEDGNVVEWERNPGNEWDLRRRSYLGPMPMWRRSLHTKHGMFDSSMIVSGDYDFWARIGSRGEKILYIPDRIGVYRARRDSLEHRNGRAKYEENEVIRARYYGAGSETKCQEMG